MSCIKLPADYRDARQTPSPYHRLTPPLPVRSDHEWEQGNGTLGYAQGTPER